MSEPCQLFARVRLSRERFETFLRSSFELPLEDAALFEWLDEAHYVGDPLTPANVRQRIGTTFSVADWIEGIAPSGETDGGYPSFSINEYDDDTQTWTLVSLDFSESYDDFIPTVALFRKLAEIKDLAPDGTMLIYGYVYDAGRVIAALRLGTGTSNFLNAEQFHPVVAQADAYLAALMQTATAESGRR